MDDTALPSDADFDEALLLDETEALLCALHPTAFVHQEERLCDDSANTSDAATAASTSCSNSSSNSNNNSNNNSSNSSNCNSDASGAAAPKRRPGRTPKPGSKQNPSRERMQRELVTLREQVESLETQLLAKRSAQQYRLPPCVWESLAKRQRQHRDRTEHTNKRLKARIEAQYAFATDLFQKLQQSAAANVANPFATIVRHNDMLLEPRDVQLLESLVASLEPTYRLTGSVFADSELVAVPFATVTAKTRVSQNGSEQTFTEVAACKLVPLDYELYRQVAWTLTTAFHCTGNSSSIRYTRNGDCAAFDSNTLAVRQRFPLVRNGKRVIMTCCLAMRRYSATQKELWVWRAVLRGEQSASSSTVDETGWLATSSVAAGDVPPSVVGTVLRECVRFELRRDASADDGVEPDKQLLTDLLESSSDEVAELSARIEGLVLQRARERVT